MIGKEEEREYLKEFLRTSLKKISNSETEELAKEWQELTDSFEAYLKRQVSLVRKIISDQRAKGQDKANLVKSLIAGYVGGILVACLPPKERIEIFRVLERLGLIPMKINKKREEEYWKRMCI